MLRLRAPRRDEAEAVHAVILARDVADMGRPDYSLQDVRDDWELPGLDLERDVFVVEDDDGTLIGCGHGRALLLALLDAFRAAGMTTAELSVAGTNAPATGLYESAGMTPDVRIERWDLTRSSG